MNIYFIRFPFQTFQTEREHLANMIIYKDLFGGNDEMASDTYKIKVNYSIGR